jgi:uncharacterized RmlC-like cupin family protein
MVREEAVATDGMWSGFVRTASGSVSGWHHHGSNETTIYLVAGAMRIEWGPGGREVVDLAPHDFCFIPPGMVHRESNPSDEESHAIVVRAGIGPPTINVDAPEEA